MTLRTWLFNVTPDGTAANTTNIVAEDGTHASTVASGTGGSTRFSTSHVHQGAACLNITSNGGGTGTTRLPFTPNVKGTLSVYRYIGALTGATIHPIYVRGGVSGADSGTLFRIGVTSSGKVGIYNSGGTLQGTVSTGSVTENAINRFDIKFDIGSSNSTGSATVEQYVGDATGTPNATTAVTGADLGGAASVQAGFLCLGTLTAVAVDQFFDSARSDDGSTTMLGPYVVSNVKPTVAAIANQAVAPSTPVSFTAVPTDSDGTITAHEWTVAYSSISGFTTANLTGASTATVSFTTNASTAGELVILQYRAQDNGGLWSDPVTVECTTPTSNTTVGFLPGNGAGASWVNTGGAASIGAALSDSSDTTYVESPAYAASPSIHWQRYRPMTPGAPGTVVNRHAETATGGTTVFYLAEGDAQTVRSTQPLTQSTSIVNETDDISAATISDWTKVWGGMSVAS